MEPPPDLEIADEPEWLPVVARASLGVSGALLLLSGVARRSLFGLALAGAGAYLVKRALSKRLPIVP
jgi:uncharacterized membrane protein